MVRQHVVVEIDGDLVAPHCPTRRRLHTGGEMSSRNHVPFGTDLLNELSPEVNIGILVAENRPVGVRNGQSPARVMNVAVPALMLNSIRSALMRLSGPSKVTLLVATMCSVLRLISISSAKIRKPIWRGIGKFTRSLSRHRSPSISIFPGKVSSSSIRSDCGAGAAC